jgi:small subunit ribosomal protein S21
MKERKDFEKPTAKRKRQKAEAVRRWHKVQRKLRDKL